MKVGFITRTTLGDTAELLTKELYPTKNKKPIYPITSHTETAPLNPKKKH